MNKFINRVFGFLDCLSVDYKIVWEEYPAPLVWTAVISFILGGIFL